MNILIKNTMLKTPQYNGKYDVFISEGQIKRIESSIDHMDQQTKVIDAKGKLLSAGLIDVHVHLREPGGEHKETIETGTKAAARGGFTTICPMPNTRPVPDQVETMENLEQIISSDAVVKVLPYASITKRQLGNEHVDFEALSQCSTFAFTDDGVGVQSAHMMYAAMQHAAKVNKAIVAHCEENTLIYNGAVHAGDVSERLNIPGIPSICEATQIARDVLLSEASGCHYHVCHVSTKESVRVIRDAKKAGIHVTAEVTPHHLLLCEDDIKEHDTNYKMNPPLRSKEDQVALIEGLLDGTIDMIATDHAPHAEDEKNTTMEKAPFGIVGSEITFSLLYTHFVKNGEWSLEQLLSYLTTQPKNVFGLDVGEICEGAIADLALFDLDNEYTIDANDFASKSCNTPFLGEKVYGETAMTIVDGEIIYERGVTQWT